MLKTKDGVRWQEQNEGKYFIYYNQDVFEANEVVIRVIELCRNPQTSENLGCSLLKEYDTDTKTLDTDLVQIILQLREINILEEVDNEQ